MEKDMPRYRVSWEIDIVDAVSPEDAARQAHAIQQRPGTSATVFDVIEFDSGGEAVSIDLTEIDLLAAEIFAGIERLDARTVDS
jgi:hypothetical protein